MLVILRDAQDLTMKASFLTELIKSSFDTQLYYVFRKETNKFKEKWDRTQIELATSTKGILLYFLLMMLKSPRDLRDGLLRRLFHKRTEHRLITEGFLSILSEALYQYFARSARTGRIVNFLRKKKSSKIFLVDEFWSLNMIRLKHLKSLGLIIYVSQDLAHNRYGYGDNFITRVLMSKFERNFVSQVDLVIACSKMEQLQYLGMGAKKAIIYPNLYPSLDFEPGEKDQTASICIVMREHWRSRGERALKKIFKAVGSLDKQIKVYMIGMKPQEVPKNVVIEYNRFAPSIMDYLRIISKSWIGINIGIHKGGTNKRRYDYAEAGLVVFSDTLGSRGAILPREFVFSNYQDLASKLKKLLEYDKAQLIEMGKENRKYVLNLAEKKRKELLREVGNLILARAQPPACVSEHYNKKV
jgi:hypothetical protein